MRLPLAAFALVLLAPFASAHGATSDLHDELVRNGQQLVVGPFTAAQPGALVVVPHVSDVPTCAATPSAAATLALGDDAAVAFFEGDDGLHALVDLPPGAGGYLAVAVDTHDASRALIMMQESAVAVHGLVAVTWSPDQAPEVRTGVLGVPYALPGAPHGHSEDVAPEGRGMLLAHDGSFKGGRTCAGDAPGHRAFSFSAASLPGSVAPGHVVHVIVLADPTVPAFLPHPLDATTRVLEVNLYLARGDEDPAAVREAFAATPGPEDITPLALAAIGLVWVARPR